MDDASAVTGPSIRRNVLHPVSPFIRSGEMVSDVAIAPARFSPAVLAFIEDPAS
jgi:hypothetical protein